MHIYRLIDTKATVRYTFEIISSVLKSTNSLIASSTIVPTRMLDLPLQRRNFEILHDKVM